VSNDEKKYRAFISYRHADNNQAGRQWATWLHQAIETYEVPEELVGKENARGEIIPARIFPIFRDEQALPAHSDLGNAITRALDDTHLLVILCSPNARASKYVSDEIDYFKRAGYSDRIIAAEPNTSWDTSKHRLGFSAEDECFPEPLQYLYSSTGQRTEQMAEPIAAVFRINLNGKKEQGWTNIQALRKYLESPQYAQSHGSNLSKQVINESVDAYKSQLQLMLLKIVAGIIGVPLDDLTQRDKAYQLELANSKAKRLRQWLIAVGLLAIIAVMAGIFAYEKQKEAIANEKVAQEQRGIAQNQLINANHNFGMVVFERAMETFDEKRFSDAAYYAARLHPLLKTSELKQKNNDLWMQSIQSPKQIWASPVGRHHDDFVNDVAISSNGKLLITGGYDNKVKIWEVKTGELKASLLHDDDVNSVALSPDGKVIAVGANNSTIYLWDRYSEKITKVLTEHTRMVNDVLFSSDGTTLYLASMDGTVRKWDVHSDNEESRVVYEFDNIVSDIAISTDDTMLAMGSKNRAVVWDLNNNLIMQDFKALKGSVFGVEFSPDTNLLSIAHGSRVDIWNLALQQVLHVLSDHFGQINSVSFSSDSKLLVTTGNDEKVILWNVKQGTKIQTFEGHSSYVRNAGFSTDNSSIYSVAWDNTIRVWDINNQDDVKLAGGSHIDDVNAVAISPDGNIIASASVDKSIHLRDTQTGKILHILKGHKEEVFDISFTYDGTVLASGSRDRTVKLWSVKNGELLRTLTGHRNLVRSVAFSPS